MLTTSWVANGQLQKR